jgi:hypothetical protein
VRKDYSSSILVLLLTFDHDICSLSDKIGRLFIIDPSTDFLYYFQPIMETEICKIGNEPADKQSNSNEMAASDIVVTPAADGNGDDDGGESQGDGKSNKQAAGLRILFKDFSAVSTVCRLCRIFYRVMKSPGKIMTATFL